MTLAGGVGTSTDAWSLLRRVPTLADQPSVTLDVFSRILASLYPGAGMEHECHAEAEARDVEAPPVQIAGIRPDLLGEQLVDRQMGKLIDAAFGDGAPDDLVKSALTVLNRLAGRRPGSVSWLHAAFTHNPHTVVVGALEVATATSDPIGVELAKWIAEHRHADITATLYSKIPYPTVALRELGLAVTEAVVAALRANTSDPDAASLLAGALNNLGIWLRDLGRRDEALAAQEEAVRLWRELASAQPDTFNPDLAGSLSNLGISLRELGRHEEALAATEQAVRLRRELAASRPDASNPHLAASLSNLGMQLNELGRHGEALAATEEAVAVYRDLAAAQPDAVNPDLAASLSNLGLHLSDLGRREEALAAEEEAVRLRRELAAVRPDAFNPDLALSLSNLGIRLRALGRRDEALAAAEEAVRLWRELAASRLG